MRDQEISTLSLDKIVVSQGRELNPEVVALIASSIQLNGLQNPISVVETGDGSFRIISGRHRLAAVRLIGRDQIDALIYRGLSDIEIRLAEIVENPHRAELTVMQRSEQIAEYAKLVEERRGQGVVQLEQHPSNVKGASGRGAGDSAAARDLGLDRSALLRANKIANIDPAAKEAGLGDNQSARLEIAAAPNEQQAIVVSELAEKRTKKAKTKRSKRCVTEDVKETIRALISNFSFHELQIISHALTTALGQPVVDLLDLESLLLDV